MTEGTSSLFTQSVPPFITITLVSSASMNVFKDNTLANLSNLLSEEISWQGEWRVAVTEITFPPKIDNVINNNILYYKNKKRSGYSKHESWGRQDPLALSWRNIKTDKRRVYEHWTNTDWNSSKQRIREIGLRYRSHNQTSFITAPLLGRFNLFKPANS